MSTNRAVVAGELLRSGQVTRLDALAEVRDSVDTDGSRVIDVRLAGGLSFEVLPQRGLDIGSVWHLGSPVSWRSALPIADNNDTNPSSGFLSRFTGGMLVTCGLENIGAARDGRPMHGSHHRTPAADVRCERELDGDDIVVTVSGLIGSMELFGRRVTMERRIVSRTGTPRLDVLDRIRNEGYQPAPVALLYHVNFGAPFLDEGTSIEVDTAELDTAAAGASEVRPQCESVDVSHARSFPAPVEILAESVFDYVSPSGRATVIPRHGGRAIIEWDVANLPRLFQWVWPAKGGWALGIEPSNSPLIGDERELMHAGAPLLEPGSTIETGFSLTLVGNDDTTGAQQ